MSAVLGPKSTLLHAKSEVKNVLSSIPFDGGEVGKFPQIVFGRWGGDEVVQKKAIRHDFRSGKLRLLGQEKSASLNLKPAHTDDVFES